jgi:hypothetical protein
MFTQLKFEEKHRELSILMTFPPIDNDPDVRDELQDDMVAEGSRMESLFQKNDHDQDAEYDGEPYGEIAEKHAHLFELAAQYQKRFKGDEQAAYRHIRGDG